MVKGEKKTKTKAILNYAYFQVKGFHGEGFGNLGSWEDGHYV